MKIFKKLKKLKRIFSLPQKSKEEKRGFSLGGQGSYRQKKGKGEIWSQFFASDQISTNLEWNLNLLKKIFQQEKNSDIVIREFSLALDPPAKGALIFIEGLTDRTVINQNILQPLMLLANISPDAVNNQTIETIYNYLLPTNQAEKKCKLEEIVQAILTGTGVLLVDGASAGLVIEIKGWEHRTVAPPITEQVVRGPQEAFTELLRTNTALIRRRIRTPKLIMEGLKIGEVSKTDVVIAYIADLANPVLIEEVRARINSIKIDYLPDSGYLEHYMEDNPYGIFPETLSTERPDRVTAFLSEGHVAILVDGSPFAIVAPITFTAFIHSPEDYYLKWPFGTLLRLVRLLGIFFALFLPSIYIAITNYHQEMIPTSLLLAIAASREFVPFPVFVEVVLMELALELIREAGIRIPSAIGPTIGIVGALILGQAAVQAGIISPLLVIVVALTALGSFTIPNFTASFSLRLFRFPLTILGAVLGFEGVAAGTILLVMHLASLKSFGVPYMSPIAPYRGGHKDIILMGNLSQMKHRPSFIRPLDEIRQPKENPSWRMGKKNKQQDDKEGNKGD